MKSTFWMLVAIIAAMNVGCGKARKEDGKGKKAATNFVTSGSAETLFKAMFPLDKEKLLKLYKGKAVSVKGKIAVLSSFGNSGLSIKLRAGGPQMMLAITFADKGKAAKAKKISSGQEVSVSGCTVAGKSNHKIIGKVWKTVILKNCKLN